MRIAQSIALGLMGAWTVLGCSGGPSGQRASSSAAADSTAQFVGLRYPPFPSNLREEGGAMIAVGGKFEYALNVVSRDSTTFVWLSRLTDRNAAGEPGFEVRAVQRIPALDSGEVLLVGRCQLKAGAPEDRSVFAVARTGGHEADSVLTDIRAAWRADVDTGAIRDVPPDSVTCANDVLDQ